MITGVAIASLSAAGAYAQTTGTPSAVSGSSAPSDSTNVQEFVVTGSRIPQPNLTSISPVTAVTSQELKISGTTRVEDLINQLPQVIADQGGGISNGASGTATVSLRDLGPSRTLVLIDGTRLGPGDPGTPYADLNFIPAALIDRIDVLTGGASATYGSDAVAGVVNFVMKKDFEGVQIDINSGLYQHDNGNAGLQADNQALGYNAPKGSIADGQTWDVAITMGASSPDGKGNVEGYLDYRHIDAVAESQRDYSNCNLHLNDALNGFACGGSATAANANFFAYNADFSQGAQYSLNPNSGKNATLSPYTGANSQLYNFAPLNYFQRNDERYSGGFFGHYEVAPHITAYASFMFMNDHTDAQIGPSGDFGTTAPIPCNNPLLSADEIQKLCVGLGYSTPANPTSGVAQNVFILRRNVEGGGRVDDITHTDYRVQIGLKGDLDPNWHFDVYGQYYQAAVQNIEQGYFSNSRLAQALDAVPGTPGSPNSVVGPGGTAVCANPANGCVPYDPFQVGGVTPAMLKFLEVPGSSTGKTTEQVVSGSITGDLGAYGMKSPWAHDGLALNIGGEYRREFLESSPDFEEQDGDLAGAGGKATPISGAFDVKEFFTELRVPIVQDVNFIKDLSFDGGYRFSHYSEAGNTDAYKFGADWAINDDIRIRGGFNRAVRAPNIDELYGPQNVELDGTTDNCSGSTPVFTQAQCARTGVSASQYGHINPNPASQYNGLVGGNPDLKPETADTYTIGTVITPKNLIPGMSFSADYFDIKITNVIQSYGENNIIDDCAETGNPTYCSLIHRAPGSGTLWLTNTGYVVDTLQNLGFIKTSGVDFTFDYRTKFSDWHLPEWGGLALGFLGTYTRDYEVQGALGTAPLFCVSKYGPTCQGTSTPQSGPLPAFKAKTRLTWTTPWTGFSASVDWRYIGPSDVDTGAQDTADSHINAYNYVDLEASWHFKDRYTVRVGCNNITDLQPPIIGSGELPGVVGNANTYSQIYDVLGRYLFMGLTADF
jgi:outer membrane receptor protein involved in Fe transport